MTNDASLEKIVQSTRSSQGALLPPLRGENKVPMATSLQVLRQTTFVGGTELTLGWIDPEDYRDNIDKFNIFLTTQDSPTPTVVAAPSRSPGKIIIQSSSKQKATIRIQTVLKNGQTSDLDISPTISVAVSSLDEVVSDAVARQYFPQVAATATLDHLLTSGNLGIVSLIGPGRIIGVGVQTSSVSTNHNSSTNIDLRITNGTNTTLQPLYDHDGATGIRFAVGGVPGDYSGAGNAVGDYLYIPYNFEFENLMSIDVSYLFGGAGRTGNTTYTVWYCLTV